MQPLEVSPGSRSHWAPSMWVACMVLMCSGLQALVPNAPKSSLLSTTPPVHEGIPATRLTPEGVSGEALKTPCGNKTSECPNYCSLCEQLNLTKPVCYENIIPVCGDNFDARMDALNSSDWCTWDRVKSFYNEFTECTERSAECLLLPWPNRVVEEKFVEIHSKYFQECPIETLRDPPPNVVLALVMTPICLIPAMVVLVVMKTKNGDGRA